jgi:transcriptional regulator with XRE-family HTH domain
VPSGPAPDPKARLGERVRELRNRRGLSQEALADKAGLDRTYISSCERGKRNVSLLTLHRIAAALEVEPTALLSLPGQDDDQ